MQNVIITLTCGHVSSYQLKASQVPIVHAGDRHPCQACPPSLAQRQRVDSGSLRPVS